MRSLWSMHVGTPQENSTLYTRNSDFHKRQKEEQKLKFLKDKSHKRFK